MSESCSQSRTASHLPVCIISNRKTLLKSPYHQVCHFCGHQQYDLKHCPQCYFTVLPWLIVCLKCGHHQNQSASWKPCILCRWLIPVDSPSCEVCCITQDLTALKSLHFKFCRNTNCGMPMKRDLEQCYRCEVHQPKDAENIISYDQIHWCVRPSMEQFNNSHSDHDLLQIEEHAEMLGILPETSGSPTGFASSNDPDAIHILFFAMIPKDAWEWDKMSKVYIRFDSESFGNFQYDYGPAQVCRDINDQNLSSLKIDCYMRITSLMKNKYCIPYKYMVYTSKISSRDDASEFIHEVQTNSSNTTRVLQISENECQPKSKIYIYDSMIYPKLKKEKGFRLPWKASKSQEASIRVPSVEEVKKKCLNLYLEPTKELILTGSYNEKCDISEITDGVFTVFQCCYEFKFMVSPPLIEKRHVDQVKKELKEWLSLVIMHLESQDVPERKLYGAVYLLVINEKLKPRGVPGITVQEMISLFRMLDLSFSTDFKEISLLSEGGKNASRKEVVDALVHGFRMIVNSLQTRKKLFEDVKDLLKALPCIHFVRDNCKSFQELKTFEWHDESLSTGKIRSAMAIKNGFIGKYISEFKMLLNQDPYTLLYICPSDDLPMLVKYVHLHLFLGILFYNLSVPNVHNKWRVSVIEPLVAVQKNLTDSVLTGEIKLCEQGFSLLSEALRRHLCNSDDHKKAVILFSYTTLTFGNRYKQSQEKCIDISETFLRAWIASKDVVGGSIFGGRVTNEGVQNVAKELKIWNFVSSEDSVQESLKEEKELRKQWLDVIKSVLESRIHEIPVNRIVNVLCEVEKHEDASDSLINICMERASRALDQMFAANQSSISCYFNSTSSRIPILLGNLLLKKYPDIRSKKEVLVTDLLKWDLWPGFLKLYVSCSKMFQKSEESWHYICTCAVSSLENVCNKIMTGNVCMDELRAIMPKEEQLIALCSLKSLSSNLPSSEDLISAIHRREMEFKHFVSFKSRLLDFINHLKGIKVEGLEDLLQLIHRPNTSDPILTLCTTSDCGQFIIECYPSVHPLLLHIDNFHVMSSNLIFCTHWNQKIKETGCTERAFTFHEVINLVWLPVLKELDELLRDLKSQKIRLSAVDKALQGLNLYSDKIQTDLKNLSEAVNICHGKAPETFWVNDVSDRIVKYWEVCTYNEPAKAFLKISDTLKLNGDFVFLEKIATQAFAEESLECIDQNFVNASMFLQPYAKNTYIQKCLEAFSECKKIIEWMKMLGDEENESGESNFSDLQNFVEIALATSAGGEGDYSTDRLINLRIIGSAFSSLLYNLPQDANFTIIHEHCRDLWKTLQQCQDLPDIMTSCEEHIEWYKVVRESQGSVEKTSFGQMRNINHLGDYEIGSIRCGILTSRSEAIHVHLQKPEDKKEQLSQYNYSLDELRNLESKLVLIAGPESSERREVDLFLDTFHTVCRIADVLLELQHHGNTEYIRWSIHFSCSMPKIFEVLQYQAKEMEHDLESWLNEVKHQRDKIYELNYFTTPQLLALREELGSFDASKEGRIHIKPDVMNLLYGISRNLTPKLIKEVLDESVLQEHLPLSSAQESKNCAGLKSQCKSSIAKSKRKGSKMESAETSCEKNFPIPSITVEDLNPDQRSYLYNLEGCGFHEKLILMAFEECTSISSMLEDVRRWCEENEDKFDIPDSESNDTDSEGSLDIEEDCMERDLLVTKVTKEGTIVEVEVHDEKQLTIRREMSDLKLEFEPKTFIETVRQVPLDKNHPAVMKLIGLGFPIEDCIKAVDRFPNDTRQAMNYVLFEDVVDMSFDSITRSQLGTEEQSLDKMRIEIPDKNSRNYMSLQELGQLLHILAKNYNAPVPQSRKISQAIKTGECNLLVVPPEHVLKSTLSLYMESPELPLPTHEEVLICSEHTTAEEVILFWKRALDDPEYRRIFCLVHAERLLYQVCDKFLFELQQFSQGKRGLKVIIICSNEDEEKSNIISKLEMYRRPYQGIHSDDAFLEYLKTHFVHTSDTDDTVLASSVDEERSSVRIVSSARAGMGKSQYIRRLKEKLIEITGNYECDIIIPVHGPTVNADSLVEALSSYLAIAEATIFHIDISRNVLRLMNCLLFSLLILRTVCDSRGRVWRVNPCHMYVVEVTIPQDEDELMIEKSTIDFLRILPRMHCKSPNEVLRMLSNEESELYGCMMDDQEFMSPPFQRVYQYIHRHNAGVSLDDFSYTVNSTEGDHQACLQTLLNEIGIEDPSWSELRHFVSFLNIQLECSEMSMFCNKSFIQDSFSGFKTFVVKFMIIMSKEFCTSSLKGEVATESGQSSKYLNTVQKYEIHEEKKWNESYHPYLFFNKDGISITFIGFNVNKHGDIIDPVKNKIIMERALTHDLYIDLRRNGVKFDENYFEWEKQKMIEKIGMLMGIENPSDPDPSYVLTTDNVIKICAIIMKFRCNIPVVIMGETGCGKTRLIRYMCDLDVQNGKTASTTDRMKNILIMKVHGGKTDFDIVETVKKAEELAKHNKEKYGIDTVLFFDEANTTDAIGLIKEIMCDRRIHGKEISKEIKLIAACNPYRKHTDTMISKLESAGLGFYVKATEVQEKLGEIPLRQLVYRVFDLPASMKPLVYDFGRLVDSTENDYTVQMVKDRCGTIDELADKSDTIIAITNVLTWSQSYMKKRTDECSFVSLRDVERAVIVFLYFYERRDKFFKFIERKAEIDRMECVGRITWALILSLSVCYHARLENRKEYEVEVAKKFKSPLNMMENQTTKQLGQAQFQAEIRWCQDVLLDNMKLGPNIAKNAALRENVFMMVVCIQLRIPLFLVGKPGSSKSLAKSVIKDSLNQPTTEFLKYFDKVQMFSYQCSQLSTPKSVIEVFNTAKRFQEDPKNTNFTSVVVLDEVGLAEDSPNLPLKVLHPLLEDGTEGSEDQQTIDRGKRVAFIGISNWALDPAKMNRGVMVTRGDPDSNELRISAEQICSKDESRELDAAKESLKPYLKHLADAYIEICSKQVEKKTAFFGLRDFYSLIKMLYWICQRTQCGPTENQLEHAIKRNFSGLEELDTYRIFEEHMKDVKKSDQSEEDSPYLYPVSDCSPLGLIETSLLTKETSCIGENRYLLFLTENYAALQILKHKLHEAVCGAKLMSIQQSTSVQKRKEPFVLFGSSFPKDREYTQVCRNINQIKICMETGRTVILLNLENLYESLYDLLNQYYIILGTSRYVDLGLQTHRVKCRVDSEFKLILIAEKETVYKTFPTPLINRLEKHFVLTETILLDWQRKVLEKLKDWVNKFSQVKALDSFLNSDAFVGFQEDTPAAVIFQATKQLKNELNITQDSSNLGNYETEVLKESYYILLQMASPDALIRLQCTALAHEWKKWCDVYFKDQKHDVLTEFLQNHLERAEKIKTIGLSLQVTTYSHLLSSSEVKLIGKKLGMNDHQIFCFLLQEFDTELDFTKAMDPIFSCEQPEKRLVIIQCDSGHLCGDLVACTRYRIDDEREKALIQNKTKIEEDTKPLGVTHVLLIVHLPRRVWSRSRKCFSFVGFQGGSWISAHIDDVHVTSNLGFTLHDAMSASISELFYSMHFVPPKTIAPQYAYETYRFMERDFTQEDKDSFFVQVLKLYNANTEKRHAHCRRLHFCIQSVIAVIAERDETRKEWAAKRVQLLLALIPKQPEFPLGIETFYGVLVGRILLLLRERETLYEDVDWVLSEAHNSRSLQSSGTFQNVLARKFDDVIIPIFANILSHVDCYFNLEIIKPGKTLIKQHLWLRLFNHPSICKFSYNETSNTGCTRKLQETLKQDFECQFPFFWVVKEIIDSNWETTASVLGTSMKQIHFDLYQLLVPTPLAEALCIVPVEQVDGYCQYYLHDFLQTVHHVTHSKSSDELEILDAAIFSIVKGSQLNYSEHQPLLSCLIAVHVAYQCHQKEILWLGQLTSLQPGVLVSLKKMDGYNEDFIDIHLCAVQIALEELELPLDLNTRHNFPDRLFRLQLCQNVIGSILELSTNAPLAAKIREYWSYVQMIKLYVEHVALEYEELIVIAKRFELDFNKRCDFSKVETIRTLEKHLKKVESTFCKRLKTKSTPDIKRRCRSFFAEVISILCFGQHHPQPEPELIVELISMVFNEQKKSTKQPSYLSYGGIDTGPVVRSFLFQLLLDYNTEAVMKHLNDYLNKSRAVIRDEQSISLLSIHCLEDAVFKKAFSNGAEVKGEKLLALLSEGKDVLTKTDKSTMKSTVTVEYLEAVAKIRFVCFSVSEVLYKHTLQRSILSPSEQLLLKEFQNLCEDAHFNTRESGPGILFLKQMARKHGMSFLTKISAQEEMRWVIPIHLRKQNQLNEDPNDPYYVYDEYHDFKRCLVEAVFSQSYDGLKKKLKVLTPLDAIPLLAAIYHVLTMSHAFQVEDPRRVSDHVKSNILSCIQKANLFNKELHRIAEALIYCSYCDKLNLMQPTLDQSLILQRHITEVVVHAALVFQTRKDVFIFQPFFKFLNCPEELKNSYLPTCPGKKLDSSIMVALGGAFNKCLNGHPYFITECGDITTEHECPQCGIKVHGRSIESVVKCDNKPSKENSSYTGYILGNPDDQTTSTYIKERNLPSSSCAVIRALMNACLTWTACANENATQGLLQLVKHQVAARDLPLLFWKNLEHSIGMLSTAISRNEDDVCLLLHAILRRLCTEFYPNSEETRIEAQLKSEDSRAKWENSFNYVFVHPIVTQVGSHLNKVHAAISRNKTQDHDPLHYAIYEKVAIPPKSIIPPLWMYRPRITMETFFQELQLQIDAYNNSLYPVLYYLFQHEPMLHATQCLPELVKLQQQLYEKYHRKIDKKEANEVTVAAFITSINSKFSQEEVKKSFQAVKSAWTLVKNNLSEYGRINVQPYISTTWDIETLSIAHLIPSNSGPGVCTNALLEGLVHVHNGFVNHCNLILERKQRRRRNIWGENEIHVKHVQHCHLVEYQKQFLSMVLSHCHYSVQDGQEQELTYDFAALEKCFIDRFIHGKPKIKLHKLEVRYREDAYSIANVKRTIPLKELCSKEKAEIVNEMKTMQSLRDTIDIVEIVMGFLSSGQYNPMMKLSKFVSKSLKMEKQFASKKALEYCNLEHVLSLWTTLSVEMAKRLMDTGQEPFVGLSEGFLLPLHKDKNQMKELLAFLTGVDIHKMLNLLFEFIEAFVKHSQDYVKSDWSLIDTMGEYLDNFEEYKETFPKSLVVGQTVAMWKGMIDYQKNRTAV